MFKKAERKKVYLKIAVMGPAGSGKTYSALCLAEGLANGGKIAGIDTENGSMSLYAHLTDFDVAELEPPFAPQKAIEIINGAVADGYSVLVIDSQTHFWKYILEEKEKMDQRGGNSFTNWGKIKPKYEALKEAILHAPIHIICCLRAKDEYVLEKNNQGKDAPKKVGMGAIAEPGAEFEYTTVFDVAMDHSVSVSKDRTGMFDGEIFRITKATGKKFLDWRESGTVVPERPIETPQSKSAAELGADALAFLTDTVGADKAQIDAFKNRCIDCQVSWTKLALDCMNRNITGYDAIMAEVKAK